VPTVVEGSKTWRSASWWALLGIGFVVAGLLLSACSSGLNRLSSVSYIVVPHPDDEMQAWSLIEDTPDTYKVFIMLTRGEQTAYCGSPGLDEGTGEAAPTPWPQGRWTASCEEARVNSFFDFISGMAGNEQGLPAAFDELGAQGPFGANGATICRFDDNDCIEDRSALVWSSSLATVVWFNLGDGDLTAEEAAWAIAAVRDNQAVLGIDAVIEGLQPGDVQVPEEQQGDGRPAERQLIGASYWNSSHPGCFVYEHADHLAVREALWNTDFGLGEQIVATCGSDPEASLSAEVTQARFDDAFEISGTERIGAHVVYYGWLWSDSPGYWAGDHTGQDELFHRRQAFWVRYADS